MAPEIGQPPMPASSPEMVLEILESVVSRSTGKVAGSASRMDLALRFLLIFEMLVTV